MDGIDDAPLSLAVVRLADYADRFLHAVPVAAGFALYYALFGRRGDVLLVAAFAALSSPNTIGQLLTRHATSLLIFALIAACGALLLRLVTLTAPSILSGKAPTAQTDAAGSVFIPGRTTHTRFFPQKHSFTYSYLTVGVPVGFRARINGILSVDPPGGRAGWLARLTSPPYEVDAADYLARGHHDSGLRGKLDRFLVGQGLAPEDYPHAFLVTAPRCLGYSFNPVSFWYLYSPDGVLSAMILEVNNTFDERRPYLVFRDFAQEAKHIQSPSSFTTSPSKIAASFDKDFHVSPFNSRKGSYSVLARDPLAPGMTGFRGLDVTIRLQSSKGHPKLVARLVSPTPAVDAASMSAPRKLLFLGRWCWVGFATFPRIVAQAAALFFRRGLHVWYRPEPLPASLGRRATRHERALAGAFRAYLQHRVAQVPEALRVRYVAAAGIAPAEEEEEEEVFVSDAAAATSSSDAACDVEIRVLTPVFYARFAHYAHDLEALFNELAESRTVAVDKPDVLPRIFLKTGAPPPPLRASNLVEFAAFKLIQVLRRTPAPIQRPMTSAEVTSSSRRPVDIRGFRISPMDAYVLEHAGDGLRATYRAAVMRLFLADRFFLGSEELLSAAELLWRAGVAYLCTATFISSAA